MTLPAPTPARNAGVAGRAWDFLLRRAGWAAFLLAVALFAVTVPGERVYDDHVPLTRDDRLRDPASWGRYLTDAYHGGPDKLYRPLGSLGLAAGWAVWGEADWPNHLINVLLHGLNSALVVTLARRLGLPPAAGLVAGLAFAVHPVHVEVVAAIVGRFDLVATAGVLGGLCLALGRLTAWRVLGVLGCFVLAVGHKEQGLLLPPLVAGALALRHGTLAPPRSGPGAWLAVGLCGLFAGYVVLKEQVLGLPFVWERAFLSPNVQPLRDTPAGERALVAVGYLGRYAELLVWPRVLSIDYGGFVLPARFAAGDAYFWVGILLLFCGIFAAWLNYRKGRWAVAFLLFAAGASWFLVSNAVVLIGVHFAERLLYLPSAFVAVLLGAAVAGVRGRPAAVWPAAAVVVVVLVAWAGRAAVYAARWVDEDAFYARSVEERPTMRLAALASQAAERRGDLDEADRLARLAIELDGREFRPWLHAALVAEQRGGYRDALRFFDHAVELQPGLDAGVRRRIAAKLAD